MPNRRDFLKTGAIAGAGALLAKGGMAEAIAKAKDVQQQDNSYTNYLAATPVITKFTEPFISAIPTAKPMPGGNPLYPGADYYELIMEGARWQFHTQLPVTSPKQFTTWQYRDFLPGGWGGIGYLGPTIEARTNVPVVVKYINNVPEYHPVQQGLDPTIPEVEIYGVMPGGRVIPHLHGGFVAPQFDGHPHAWFTKKGEHGTHFASLAGNAANEAIFYYPNNQPATGLWYHDHGMGVTRVNPYVGLAALYFIRDAFDTGTAANTLGVPWGAYEVPMVLQDKTFNLDGSLFYPMAGVSLEHPIWMPEFFADTPVINGRCYPIMTVEPRRYRFRFVNGSQARFYNIWITSPKAGNIPLKIIGSDDGLLPAVNDLNLLPLATRNQFLIGPGERFDVIADFTGLAVGSQCTMSNNAKVPFPGGGGGPAIPQLMKFLVGPLLAPDTSLAIPTLPALNPPSLVATVPAVTRDIVMKETLGTPIAGKALVPVHVRLNERWLDDFDPLTNCLIIDEAPKKGDVEMWQYINLTVDEHPMHTHLVSFQLVNRETINVATYTTAFMAWVAAGRPVGSKPALTAYLLGVITPPAAEETGWKDTIKVPPGTVTRVIAKYDLPPLNAAIAGTDPIIPAQYVYHCHILEHEENEMMRSFTVTNDGIPPTNLPRGFYKAGEKATASLPTKFALEQNYPNPFNPETTIRFSVPENSHVELRIFNSLGQDVATLVDADYAAGMHAVNWNANNFASGVYFAKIKAGNFVAAKRMTLVK